jgi:RimJ/RimL family protein N-acetyltransferase
MIDPSELRAWLLRDIEEWADHAAADERVRAFWHGVIDGHARVGRAFGANIDNEVQTISEHFDASRPNRDQHRLGPSSTAG